MFAPLLVQLPAPPPAVVQYERYRGSANAFEVTYTVQIEDEAWRARSVLKFGPGQQQVVTMSGAGLQYAFTQSGRQTVLVSDPTKEYDFGRWAIGYAVPEPVTTFVQYAYSPFFFLESMPKSDARAKWEPMDVPADVPGAKLAAQMMNEGELRISLVTDAEGRPLRVVEVFPTEDGPVRRTMQVTMRPLPPVPPFRAEIRPVVGYMPMSLPDSLEPLGTFHEIGELNWAQGGRSVKWSAVARQDYTFVYIPDPEFPADAARLAQGADKAGWGKIVVGADSSGWTRLDDPNQELVDVAQLELTPCFLLVNKAGQVRAAWKGFAPGEEDLILKTFADRVEELKPKGS